MTETTIGCQCGGCARIDLCQFETDPFTAAEQAALDRYEFENAGVADCFGNDDTLNMLATIPEEWGRDETLKLFRLHFSMLNGWRDSIRTLAGALTEGRPLSTAGRRYLQLELSQWKQAQEGHRALVIEHTLGRDKDGQPFTTAAIVHGCQIDGNVQAGVFDFAMQG